MIKKIKPRSLKKLLMLGHASPKDWSISSTFYTRLFCTKVLPAAFFYLHVTREKLPNRLLYKKGAHKMLMKLSHVCGACAIAPPSGLTIDTILGTLCSLLCYRLHHSQHWHYLKTTITFNCFMNIPKQEIG